MRRYTAYLKYLLRHRHYVRQECWKQGLFWRGVIHDLSKFSPSEFVPYARHFYNRDGSRRQIRNATGSPGFDFAWFLHQKRNRHHWQWWVLPEDGGGLKILEMDDKSRLEIVCDWVGAGKAQGFASPNDDPYKETRTWYSKNLEKMQLHPNTREYIEDMIGWGDDSKGESR